MNYELVGDTYQVKSVVNLSSTNPIVIPASIEGIPVTSVYGTSASTGAFANSKATSITFENPENITSIGAYAFNKTKATNEISLPNITNIPQFSLSESEFSSIYFDENKITSIGQFAFNDAKATNEITFRNITTVPQYAFAASQFSKIMLDGTKITSIENHAFADTQATNEMSLPYITIVPDWSFAHAKFSGIYLNGNRVTRVAKGAFWKAEATNEMTLRYITDVAASAFEYSHFSGIYLDGTKIRSIGEAAFNNSKATNEMYLPNITDIEHRTFDNTNFSKIILHWDKITSIKEGNHFKRSDVLYEKLSDKEIKIHLTYQVTPKAISYVIQKKVDDEWIDTTQRGLLTNGLVVTYPKDESVYRISTTIEYPLLSNLNISTKTILSDEITNMDNLNEKTNEIQLNLQKGEFVLQKAQVNPFGTVKLTADKQTVSTSFESDFSVIDARGTQEGWNLSVSATPFIENTFDGFIGTPTTLPLGTLSLGPVKTINQIADIDNVQYPTTVGTTTNIIDSGEVTLLQANPGEGMGQFELDFSEDALSIVVDSSTAKIDDKNYPEGVTLYTSTITWNLITGP